MSKLIYGVGTNSGGKYKATCSANKKTKAYSAWQNMLKRAYCPKGHVVSPTYIGCSVAEEWLEYQEFAEWFENHEYSGYGYQLDKDLLLPGNKIYSPDRCVFVPLQLNTLLTDRGNDRGQCLQGVCFNKRNSKFVANINIDGKGKYLGCFDTELEAHLAYKEAKEANVKRMASLWRDNIADEVYHALMRWQLEDVV